MKSRPNCLNLAPDGAVACDHCGAVLDPSLLPPATQALRNRAETIVEPSYYPRPVPPPDLRPSAPPPLPGSVPSAAGPARRGSTVFMPPAGSQPGLGGHTAVRAPERRIVAILITYSWKPEGQVFPVRDGRNLIGRGEECDIRLQEDPSLSQVNSHITFRRGFVLGDMVSMSGTDLDDVPVEEQFKPLANFARIRTGSTQWFFVIIDPDLISAQTQLHCS